MMSGPTQEELRDLYRELILDHAKAPRHFGKLDEPSHQAEGINPLCGDKLRLYLRMGDSGLIDDIAFEGSGCAISVASASLLTEAVLGLPADTALRRSSELIDALTSEGDPTGLGKLAALQGVREFPSRVKCATLAWRALDAAISGDNSPATTE